MKTDRLKLVIVEDEEAHFRLMERAIGKNLPGARIYHFDDAESFIQKLNEIHPDVILVDYLMPGMNGIDFLEFLNRESIAVPVVMITGQGDENIAVQAMKSGAADYLVKSKDFFKLLPATIERIVREQDLEKSLHKSERLNELLMDSLPHPAMLIRADRTIVAANRAARKMGAQIGGYCWRDFGQGAYISDEDRSKYNDHADIPPDGIKCTFCLADGAVSSQSSMNAPEIRAFGRIWDTWWIPVEGDVFFHYAIDITDIKQKERELRKERDFVESLIETAPAIILLLDTEGRIVRFNRYLEELSGYTFEEVKGKKWFDTLLPQYDQDRTRKLSDTIGNAPIHGNVNPILTKDGEERHIEWYGTVIRDGNGVEIGVLSIGLDITPRLESERELRFLSSRLLSAQEDERKRIAGELHDSLGSSLSAIKIALENARRQLEEDGRIADSLAIPISWTQHAIDEARRIMTDLRPSMLDDLGLLATIGWFVRQHRTIHPEISIENELRIEEPEIPEPLKIVIFRIMQEAFHNISKYSQAKLVRLYLVNRDGAIELAIEDNGEGFDVQATLHAKSERRGLGLTSMKERAELSGGDLSIESIPGEGTVIRACWSSMI